MMGNAGDLEVQEIVALFQGEVNPDAADHLAPAEAFAIAPLAAKPCAEC